MLNYMEVPGGTRPQERPGKSYWITSSLKLGGLSPSTVQNGPLWVGCTLNQKVWCQSMVSSLVSFGIGIEGIGIGIEAW